MRVLNGSCFNTVMFDKEEHKYTGIIWFNHSTAPVEINEYKSLQACMIVVVTFRLLSTACSSGDKERASQISKNKWLIW